LRTLADLKMEVARDLRRTGASIALNKSMDSRLIRQSPRHTPTSFGGGSDLLSTPPTSPSGTVFSGPGGSRPGSRQERRISVRRTSVNQERSSQPMLRPEDIFGLEEAFTAHTASFDMDGDGTINVEELIHIFDRCRLFNEHFTPEKVRDYFRTWAVGCNHHMGLATVPPGDDEGIGFQEFKRVLHWAAAMNRIEMETCVRKVVCLSKRLCDKEASVQRRLEVVFDSFCKKHPTCMNAFEFGRLCRKLELRFSMGDIFSLFSMLPGGVQGDGVDFAGFVQLLAEVGTRLELGEEVYSVFAGALELLDTDEETINRVRLRMRHSASVVSGPEWRKFFQDCDPDGSGLIDFDEFKELCRSKLHLTDKDSHLRLLFEKIDQDGSDELSIDELIAFVGHDL